MGRENGKLNALGHPEQDPRWKQFIENWRGYLR